MKTLAKANNYKYIRDINAFYGESRGFYFYTEATQYVSLIRLFFYVQLTPQQKESLDHICDAYRAVSHDGVRIDEGKAVLEIRPQGFSTPEQLSTLIESLTCEMEKMNIKQGNDNEELGLYRIGTHIMVRTAESLREQSKELSQTFKKQSVSPLKGYLMAIVYMIPAVILFAAVMNVGFVFSFLGFIIIYQTLRGFEKYGGLPSKKQLLILMGVSFLGFVLANVISVAYRASTLPFFSLVSFLKNVPYFEFAVNVIPSFLFACAFNYYRIRDIFNNARTTHTVNRKIQKLL